MTTPLVRPTSPPPTESFLYVERNNNSRIDESVLFGLIVGQQNQPFEKTLSDAVSKGYLDPKISTVLQDIFDRPTEHLPRIQKEVDGIRTLIKEFKQVALFPFFEHAGSHLNSIDVSIRFMTFQKVSTDEGLKLLRGIEEEIKLALHLSYVTAPFSFVTNELNSPFQNRTVQVFPTPQYMTTGK